MERRLLALRILARDALPAADHEALRTVLRSARCEPLSGRTWDEERVDAERRAVLGAGVPASLLTLPVFDGSPTSAVVFGSRAVLAARGFRGGPPPDDVDVMCATRAQCEAVGDWAASLGAERETRGRARYVWWRNAVRMGVEHVARHVFPSGAHVDVVRTRGWTPTAAICVLADIDACRVAWNGARMLNVERDVYLNWRIYVQPHIAAISHRRASKYRARGFAVPLSALDMHAVRLAHMTRRGPVMSSTYSDYLRNEGQLDDRAPRMALRDALVAANGFVADVLEEE